jgi:hypothetical protein
MREFSFLSLVTIVILPVVFFGLHVTTAQVMQSTSYQIQSDSINFGGGFSTSTNYTLESTGGEVATGESSSGSYALRAGYQQMHQVYIALTAADNVSMNSSIPGLSGGESNGSTTVTVTTDSLSGYELTIEASQSPAMQKGADTIADYVPVGVPDFTFTIDATDAHFGYSPTGVDVVQRFLDAAGNCNTGAGNTDLACWDGLDTTPEPIASDSSSNHPTGATTTINFRVGIGGSVVQAPGTYTATTTLTALPL